MTTRTLAIVTALALLATASAAQAQNRGGRSTQRSFAPQSAPGFNPGSQRSFNFSPGFNPGGGSNSNLGSSNQRSFNFSPGFNPGSNGALGGSPGFNPGQLSSTSPAPSFAPRSSPGFNPGNSFAPQSSPGFNPGSTVERSFSQPGFNPGTTSQPSFAQPGFNPGTTSQPSFAQPGFNPGSSSTAFRPSTPSSSITRLSSSSTSAGLAPRPASAAPAPASVPTPAPKAPVKPEANPIRLAARPADGAELRAARDYCASQIQRMASVLENTLKDEIVDPSILIAEFSAQSVPPATQVQIFQAIRAGSSAEAEALFTSATQDPSRGADLGRQVEIKTRLDQIADAATAGTLQEAELRAFATRLSQVRVAGAKQTRARQALGELADYLKIRSALSQAKGGKAPAPASSAPAIVCPILPAGTALTIADGTLLVGSGGAGKMEIRRTTLAEALGTPVGFSGAAPDAADEPASGVLLQCPGDINATVQYKLTTDAWEQDYTMTAGHWQRIPESQVVIEFDPGSGSARKRYTLAAGTYRFYPTSNGWDLGKHNPEVLIDNSRGSQPFHYVLGDEKRTLAAGRTATHKADYPLALRYLRGEGGAEKKSILDSGRYQVALSAADSQWDLFVTQ